MLRPAGQRTHLEQPTGRFQLELHTHGKEFLSSYQIVTSIVNRYQINENKIKKDPRGPWVRHRDVQKAIDKAIEDRNALRDALVEIATIPLSLPNSAAGIKRAQQALDDIRDAISDRM